MQTNVRFDGLGISFDISRVAFEFTLFGKTFTIFWYGIIIALGFALALIYAFKSAERFKINTDHMVDVIIGGTIGAVICARLYYVAFEWDFYRENLSLIPAIHTGGLAIYGGIIGAFLVGALMCKWRKVKILDMFDLGALGFLIGQGIGRWGNFFNQEAFGTTTNLPWAMKSDTIWQYLLMHYPEYQAQGVNIDLNALGVHPTFLYESLWCLLGFVILHFVSKKHRKFSGQIVTLYGMWYGVERFFVEGLRTDSLYIPGTFLRASQLLSLILVLACIALYFFLYKKSLQKKDDLTYQPLFEQEGSADEAPAAEELSAEETAQPVQDKTEEKDSKEEKQAKKQKDKNDKNRKK